MKRYLIEPQSPATNAGTTATDTVVYRIIDTITMQALPPQSEDIGVVASACAQLNEAYENATQAPFAIGALSSAMTTDGLPDEIVQAIAISNAKSIGEQPAILANLALAQQIFNRNLQQQNAVSYQQALNQIKIAVVGKFVAMIDSLGGSDAAAVEKMGADVERLVQQLERILAGKAGFQATS